MLTHLAILSPILRLAYDDHLRRSSHLLYSDPTIALLPVQPSVTAVPSLTPSWGFRPATSATLYRRTYPQRGQRTRTCLGMTRIVLAHCGRKQRRRRCRLLTPQWREFRKPAAQDAGEDSRNCGVLGCRMNDLRRWSSRAENENAIPQYLLRKGHIYGVVGCRRNGGADGGCVRL